MLSVLVSKMNDVWDTYLQSPLRGDKEVEEILDEARYRLEALYQERIKNLLNAIQEETKE